MTQFTQVACTSCNVTGYAFPEPPDEDFDIETFTSLGGFSRAGTELLLCEQCDPNSFTNMSPEHKANVIRNIRRVIELMSLGLSREEAMEVYMSAALASTEEQERGQWN